MHSCLGMILWGMEVLTCKNNVSGKNTASCASKIIPYQDRQLRLVRFIQNGQKTNTYLFLARAGKKRSVLSTKKIVLYSRVRHESWSLSQVFNHNTSLTHLQETDLQESPMKTLCCSAKYRNHEHVLHVFHLCVCFCLSKYI